MIEGRTRGRPPPNNHGMNWAGGKGSGGGYGRTAGWAADWQGDEDWSDDRDRPVKPGGSLLGLLAQVAPQAQIRDSSARYTSQASANIMAKVANEWGDLLPEGASSHHHQAVTSDVGWQTFAGDSRSGGGFKAGGGRGNPWGRSRATRSEFAGSTRSSGSKGGLGNQASRGGNGHHSSANANQKRRGNRSGGRDPDSDPEWLSGDPKDGSFANGYFISKSSNGAHGSLEGALESSCAVAKPFENEDQQDASTARRNGGTSTELGTDDLGKREKLVWKDRKGHRARYQRRRQQREREEELVDHVTSDSSSDYAEYDLFPTDAKSREVAGEECELHACADQSAEPSKHFENQTSSSPRGNGFVDPMTLQ